MTWAPTPRDDPHCHSLAGEDLAAAIGVAVEPLPSVNVPVGVSVQWGERGFPRSYAERTYTDIRRWNNLPTGGHFTAKQTPDLVAADIRNFFSSLG